MSNCPFCRIAAGELSAEIIYQDADVLAFLDAHPLADGHALVIPKSHVERLADLPEELAGPLFAAAAKVSGAQQSILGATGITLGVNDGRVAGQAVPHLHIHLVPRHASDGGGNLHTMLRPGAPHSSDTSRRLRTQLTTAGR
ncbi:MAG: HIT domain-containing protein [Candidatus Bipolaricaulota bacterium]